ncbi:ABC transporter permease [Clostridium estertheticum]|uniref:ABC transporter permease n=1 Tax=Clostridium estertheticum TaxID=238834 RepID=UPI001C6F24B5|nr:ABC transporter permease [Clostridium estertheticum]MBW9172645.1 ABC transporter permease [Clostridium estertheticum]WLC73612.1 ABC transporter permease [Clostridium estertheticum]
MNKLVSVILLKELKDMLRDKKTIIISLLIPLLLMPVLSFIMGKTMNSAKDDVSQNTKIVMVDKGNSNLGKILKKDKSIKFISGTDGQGAVKDGKALLFIEIPKDFDSFISKGNNSGIKIFYDNTSQKSSIALSKVTGIIDELSKEIVGSRLTKRNIDIKILTPITVAKTSFQKEENAEGQIILGMLIPIFVLLYSATGTIAAATDLGAGEKERGTLEPLLTTKAGRRYILTGKLYAITIMGFIVSVCSMIGILVSMKIPGGMFGNGSTAIALGYKAIALIGVISIITTMFFGALELAVSVYARSFKEAQTYLTPFSIVPIFAAYGTMYMDAKNIPFLYFNIPLLSVSSVVKELTSGVYNYGHIGITIGWSIVYTIVAIIFARHMFNKESVIFRS